jgi:hypothetical protein
MSFMGLLIIYSKLINGWKPEEWELEVILGVNKSNNRIWL